MNDGNIEQIRNVAYFGLLLNSIAIIMFAAVVTSIDVSQPIKYISVIGFILFLLCDFFYVKIINTYNKLLEP